MRLKHAWWVEAQIALTLVGLAIVLGLVLGHMDWWLVVALITYLLRLMFHAHQFAVWLEAGSTKYPPDSVGIFAIISQLAFRQKTTLEEEGLRLSHLVDELTRSAQALPDSIVVLDDGFHIRWCNAAATRLLGISPEQDQGQALENFVRHPEFARYLRDGNFSDSLRMPAPANPDLVLSAAVVPYGVGQNLLVARDETESLRVEKVRRDFISNVSHEMRTPITVLKGYLERLTGPTPPNDERRARSYEVMNTQVNRMAAVVEDLLLLSRLESVDSAADEHWLDVHQLLTEVRDEAEALSEESGHRINLMCDPAVSIWADYQELRTAFSNLVRNAIQYSPNESEVTIRWARNEHGAQFSVTDQGDGIEAAHLPRLTERFYRVDTGRSRESGGTGLGLAIVKHVLNHYGAHLDITSQVGEGSTFVCQFPAERIKTNPAAA